MSVLVACLAAFFLVLRQLRLGGDAGTRALAERSSRNIWLNGSLGAVLGLAGNQIIAHRQEMATWAWALLAASLAVMLVIGGLDIRDRWVNWRAGRGWRA